jgi:hypothetical protein
MPPSQSCRKLRFPASGLSDFWRGRHFSASGLNYFLANFWRIRATHATKPILPELAVFQLLVVANFGAGAIFQLLVLAIFDEFWRIRFGTVLPMTKRQSLDKLTVNRIKSVGSVPIMRHRAPLYETAWMGLDCSTPEIGGSYPVGQTLN